MRCSMRSSAAPSRRQRPPSTSWRCGWPPATTGSPNWFAGIRISPPKRKRWTRRSVAAVSKERVEARSCCRAARPRPGLPPFRPNAPSLQKTLSAEFPDYAALSNPLPMTVKEIQSLLSGDEAMVLFAVTEKESYAIAITREGFDWKPLRSWRGSAVARRSPLSAADSMSPMPAMRPANPACSIWRSPTELYNTLLGPRRDAGQGQAQPADRRHRAR